jgi:hypothetical protein
VHCALHCVVSCMCLGSASHMSVALAAAVHLHPSQSYLGEVRKELRCSSITYVSCNKDTHLLEVPEATKVRPSTICEGGGGGAAGWRS